MKKKFLVPMYDTINYDEVIRKYPFIQERNHLFVVDPDADGWYCAMILTTFLNWKCVGFYNDRIRFLKDGVDENEVIYVDIEMYDPLKKSIGNHFLSPKSTKKFENELNYGFYQCINPNILMGISLNDYIEKYPFGTCHLLLPIISYALKDTLPLSNFLNTLEKWTAFTYADGMFKSMNNYYENCVNWLKYLKYDEEWNPFKFFDKLSPTLKEPLEALSDFTKKIDNFSIEKQRGDRLTLTNKKGNIEGCVLKDNGMYAVKKENLDGITGFLKMIFNIFGLDYDNNKFDCWDNLKMTKYEKFHTKNGNKDFISMFQKKPVSYAITKTNQLEYTVSETIKAKAKKGRPFKSESDYLKDYPEVINDIVNNRLTKNGAAKKYGLCYLTVKRIMEAYNSFHKIS